MICGAGRIGRGFAADVFQEAGFDLCFWDNNQALLKKMKDRGQYSILKLGSPEGNKKTVISDYTVCLPGHADDVAESAYNVDLIAVSVFPDAFDSVAETLSKVFEKRMNSGVTTEMNIVILANIPQAGKRFKESLFLRCDDALGEYIGNYIGISEAIVIRMAVTASREMLEEDELVVPTNGYPVLYIDSETFKGGKIESRGIVFVDHIESWEKRKLFTYNMVHALFAYMGSFKGLNSVYDCMNDEELTEIAREALGEIGAALQKKYGFDPAEMAQWNENCLENMKNPYLNDRLARVGMDPVRKLKRGDRLTGAALLCKQAGIMPYWITKTIAYAFLYRQEEDEASQTLNAYVRENGIRDSVIHFCGLEKEAEIVQLICDRYHEALENGEDSMIGNREIAKLYKKAWQNGFIAEKEIRGCAQGTLFASKNSIGVFNEEVFKAATAYSAGMAMCGDCACGGYSGGLMVFGQIHYRGLDDLEKNNKAGLYKGFQLGQLLHDMFMECYGGVLCKDVQKSIYGRAYILRDPADKAQFEDAGAHRDKCTTVIGMVQYFIIRVLEKADPKFLSQITAPLEIA